MVQSVFANAHVPSNRVWNVVRVGMVLSCCLIPLACSREPRNGLTVKGEASPGAPLNIFRAQPIGNTFETPPKISFVDVVDLDQDGLLDILVCDCVSNEISWIHMSPGGSYSEDVLATGIGAPARAEVIDFDGDGDLDIFVASLGFLYPTNEKIGSVIMLENLGEMNFEKRAILTDVARVSDVRAGDLDEDGDLDLVVTHFGYDDGEVRWMENLGQLRFDSHVLLSQAGGIHGIIADVNADDHLDITVLLSQEHEQIHLFTGDGKGGFTSRTIYAAGHSDYGSSGIWLVDLDRDGDLDILYCNGDAFDYTPPRPWPWHGIQWLENLDGRRFQYRRLVELGGAVNACPVDFDGDNDTDIIVSSTFNDWESPAAQSLILLENTGNMRFSSHDLANAPTHIQALAIGDINADGYLDLVTGGMHVYKPYDRMERIALWLGRAEPAAQPPQAASH